MKRVLSIVLALAMIVSMFAGLQITSSALAKSGKCGENATYTFDSSTGVLTIGGTGKISDCAFQGNEEIKKCIINSGITVIGGLSFWFCTSLTDIVIPDTVNKIYSDSFDNCSGLKSIQVAEGNTVYDSRENCNAIIETATNELMKGSANTVIPNTVTSICGDAFSYNSSLQSINIPDSVTDIGYYAFENCEVLTTVTMGNSVKTIYRGAFLDCKALSNITLGNSVETIYDSAFEGCENLKNIIIPDSVTSIGDEAFAKCTSLTSFTVPKLVRSIGSGILFNSNAVENIEVDSDNEVYDSRDNCNAIIESDSNKLILGCKNTIIPDSVISIGGYAFDGCSDLTSITIPNSIISIGKCAFYGCTGLKNINISESVLSIDDSAFFKCESLTNVFIPASVKSFGESVFSYCNKLENLTVAKENNKYDSRNNCNAIIESETDRLVQGCNYSVVPDSVLTIGSHAFYGFYELESIVIPNSVKIIDDFAFYDCFYLKELTMFSSVTRIGDNAFLDCCWLFDIFYTGTKEQWEAIDIEDDSYGFANATIHYNFDPNHVHSYKAVVIAPKANAVGYTKYKCECGEWKTDEAGEVVKDNFKTPTGKPAGFKCASRTATSEKFTWNKTVGVSGYQIQLLNSAGKSAGIATTTGTAYTFSKLASGHAYKVRVRFYIKAADGKNYYGAWATITSPTLPAGSAITKFTPAKKAFTAVWKKVAVTGYQLQYGTNAKFAKATTKTIKGAAKVKLAVKGLKGGARYYVRVRTFKTIAGKNYYSAWSGAKVIKTK